MVLNTKAGEEDCATAQPVIALNVRLIKLGHSVSAVLKVNLVLPVSGTQFGNKAGFGLSPAQRPFPANGAEKQAATLLRRDQSNAPLVVDDVSVGVNQILKETNLSNVRTRLKTPLPSKTPATRCGPPHPHTHGVGSTKAQRQLSGWGMHAGMQNQLCAWLAPCAGFWNILRFEQEREHRQGEPKAFYRLVHFKGKLSPTKKPLSKEPPDSWAIKVQSL